MARIFVYDGREHPDPDPEMSVDDVRKTMADFFGELATATVKETTRGEDTIYEFQRRVGTKGIGYEDVFDVLVATPATNLKLLEIAEERATDNGGIVSGAYDHTDEWLSAVAQAEEYMQGNAKMLRDLEKACTQYHV